MIKNIFSLHFFLVIVYVPASSVLRNYLEHSECHQDDSERHVSLPKLAKTLKIIEFPQNGHFSDRSVQQPDRFGFCEILKISGVFLNV